MKLFLYHFSQRPFGETDWFQPADSDNAPALNRPMLRIKPGGGLVDGISELDNNVIH